MTEHIQTVTRATQLPGRIYVHPVTGTVFVVPDEGSARVFFNDVESAELLFGDLPLVFVDELDESEF